MPELPELPRAECKHSTTLRKQPEDNGSKARRQSGKAGFTVSVSQMSHDHLHTCGKVIAGRQVIKSRNKRVSMSASLFLNINTSTCISEVPIIHTLNQSRVSLMLSIIYLTHTQCFCLVHIPSTNMEEAQYMKFIAASHQGAIKMTWPFLWSFHVVHLYRCRPKHKL